MPALHIPSLCLVVLVDGDDPMGALSRLDPDEVLRFADFERVLGGEARERAGELMTRAAEHRLALGRLTAVEAGALDRQARQAWVRLAKTQHVPAVALTTKGLRLDKEGFEVRRLEAPVDGLVRERPESHRHDDTGPFDIIGDVHGCADELRALLAALGYALDEHDVHIHPGGRRALFLGDLVDRGPDAVGALRIAMRMVDAGRALCIEGNHEAKLIRKLRGKAVKLDHGLDRTWAQFESEAPTFHTAALAFLEGLPHHLVLDGGRLVCAHAGLAEALHGRQSGRVRSFALYGDTTGESDPDGLPVRRDWAGRYRGAAAVIYGHTPVSQALWRNGTLCIDTGCVFGGELTALRWPERELVRVPATRTHYPPPRPLAPPPALPRLEGALEVVPWEGALVRVSAEDVARATAQLASGDVLPSALVYLPSDSVPTAPDLSAALTEFRDAGAGEALVREVRGAVAFAALLVRPETTLAPVAWDAAGRALVDATDRAHSWSQAAEDTGLFEALATDWVVVEGTGDPDRAAFAPHLLLASEGRLHVDRNRSQHLVSLRELGADPPEWREVHLADQASWDAAARWAEGREIGVSPLRFCTKDDVPHALRVASAEVPHVGARPGKRRRWRAARRHRMGIEALRRHAQGLPLGRVRECLVAVLATP
ncbi:MAG: metallophosphoesterase [Sandaracinaceae bacterium]